MSFWTSLESIAKNILATVGHGTLTFFAALASSIETQGGQVLIHAATNAVVAAEQTGGSGADKFKAAQAAVLSELAHEGVSVALNAVNGAIEAAVANIKAEPGVVPAPQPAHAAEPEPAQIKPAADQNGTD